MPSVQVDLADAQDIAAKLPAILDARERARETYTEASETLNYWNGLVDTLEARLRRAGMLAQSDSGDVAKPARASGEGSAQARVLKIVNEANRDMSVGEVAELMPDVKRRTVQWALWKASQMQQLLAKGNGIYAPQSPLARMVLGPEHEDDT